MVKKQNCMHFAEEHCFGCASTNEYGYPTAHKTFTTRLERYDQFR